MTVTVYQYIAGHLDRRPGGHLLHPSQRRHPAGEGRGGQERPRVRDTRSDESDATGSLLLPWTDQVRGGVGDGGDGGVGDGGDGGD